MTEEHIIKRRLMFDGEGTGDDRRINLLQKMIVKWVLTDYQSQEENQIMYNKILSQLCLIEHSRQKSDLVKLKNEKQLQQYKDYQNEVAINVENVKETINTSKIILTEVKCEKHQKLMYNMIVKDIVEQPSRVETTKCAGQLQMTITNMRDSQKILENEFTLWRKHFIVLLTSANQIRLRLDGLKAIESSFTNDVLK
ncbi:hypothetical protein NQ314_003918 [Rhamnusium bicolor]|uniref:Uncharacterized protein n=1 Tax=Rhamnusium bicolor TaxID=1586634 RepID=A0AAV8ZN05_9CUCU|nr:hypothetical protein NQ314_003918 [Rhamnusium bicolor]